MAVTKWSLGGNTFDWNPADDTGWVSEVVMSEHVPPNATKSVIQYGGKKSSVRTAKGVTKSSTLRNALDALQGSTVAFSDHFGAANTVFVKKFSSDMVRDVTNLPPGGTFSYTLELVKIS